MVPDVDNQDLSERLEVCAARSAIVPFPDYAQIKGFDIMNSHFQKLCIAQLINES